MRQAVTKTAQSIAWGGQQGPRKFPTSAASALSQQRLSPSASMEYHQIPPSTQLTKPLLLVSDLDDTLTRNTLLDVPNADAATSAFKAMWEASRAAGIDCKLAINTGRCAVP